MKRDKCLHSKDCRNIFQAVLNFRYFKFPSKLLTIQSRPQYCFTTIQMYISFVLFSQAICFASCFCHFFLRIQLAEDQILSMVINHLVVQLMWCQSHFSLLCTPNAIQWQTPNVKLHICQNLIDNSCFGSNQCELNDEEDITTQTFKPFNQMKFAFLLSGCSKANGIYVKVDSQLL